MPKSNQPKSKRNDALVPLILGVRCLFEPLTNIDGFACVENLVSVTHATLGDHFHRLQIYHGHVKGEGPGVVLIIGVDVRVTL